MTAENDSQNAEPAFPIKFNFRSGTMGLQLHADGTYTGVKNELLEYMAKAGREDLAFDGLELEQQNFLRRLYYTQLWLLYRACSTQ